LDGAVVVVLSVSVSVFSCSHGVAQSTGSSTRSPKYRKGKEEDNEYVGCFELTAVVCTSIIIHSSIFSGRLARYTYSGGSLLRVSFELLILYINLSPRLHVFTSLSTFTALS
jgi:hypothetical protein